MSDKEKNITLEEKNFIDNLISNYFNTPNNNNHLYKINKNISLFNESYTQIKNNINKNKK